MAKKVAARTLDFSNVKEGSGISAKHKEDGEYLATITEVRDDPAKDGEAMWLFIVRLDSDRTATYGYYCKLVDNQLWKLRNLFIAAGVDVPKKAAKLDPNRLVNKQVGVILETEEYNERERSTIGGVIPKDELAEYAGPDEDDDEDDEDEDEAPAPKKRGRPAKAKVVEEEDDDDEDDEEEEPAPKKRGRGRPKKVVEEEDDDDEDEDDEPAPAPKRGRGRPRKVVEEPDDDDDEDDEPEPPKRKRGRPAKAAAAPAKKRRRASDDDDDDLELDL